MPAFMYISGDLRHLSEEEQQKRKVRCGQIDPERIFEHLCGYHADAEKIIATKSAIDAAMPYLTRCQCDLLRAEFGTDETTVAKLSTPTDALFDDPADANTRKLIQALDMILEYLRY